MNRVAAHLARIASDLDDIGVQWAVVGGLAVSVWAEPRLTRDVDVAVAVTDDREAERILRQLHDRGYTAAELVEHEAAARLATARLSLGTDPGGVIIDLLFASSGIEREATTGAQVIEVFPSVRARVAARPHLIAMKLLARDDRARPQDADDLRALLRTATETDIEAVRDLLRLINERGFARRRDLESAFDAVLREREQAR